MNPGLTTLKQHKTLVVLTMLTIIGSILRLYQINFQSLWYDELHSIIPTAPEQSIASIIEYCKGDQPPFFFIYIHYTFKLFGYSGSIGRIACAFIGIISIPVIYLLGKEYGGRVTGLFASLLISVNYFHITYSQELRFYSMTFFLAALSYLFFIRAYRFSRFVDFGVYTMSTIALLYTHYFGLVIFGVQAITFVVLIFISKRDIKFIVASLVSGLIVVLAFIPWIPIIINDLGIKSFWIKAPDFYFLLDYLYNYFGKDALTTTILGVFAILFFKRFKISDPVVLILVLWLVLSYLLPYVRSITSTPILHIRYTLISLPAWIIIFALGWITIKKIKLRYALVAIIFIGAWVNLIFFRKYYTKITKQQFREVVQVVKSENVFDFPVISSLPWHFNFYFRDHPSKVKGIDFDFSNTDQFWLLQVEFFTPLEKEDELKKFKDTFDVIRKASFYKADALLLKRKKIADIAMSSDTEKK